MKGDGYGQMSNIHTFHLICAFQPVLVFSCGHNVEIMNYKMLVDQKPRHVEAAECLFFSWRWKQVIKHRMNM